MDSKLTRRAFNGAALSAAIVHSIDLRGLLHASRHGLVHPGMLHSKDDLDRIRRAVSAGQEPILSGFEVFRRDPHSQPNYAMRGPVAEVGRNPTVHVDIFDSDCNAAYQCALMWCITGNLAYSRVAIGILNGWTAELKEITGADAVLCASLGGFKLVNAAELLRHTKAGWSPGDVQKAADLFRDVLLPAILNFAPFANGNWDTAAMKCMMAIGIFCDDVELLERALDYYLHGCGDGRLENYIYRGGQCQESGRDQQHTQLGLGHMGDACEMAWNQGLDLYGAVANRLLEGFEYTARYNLGSEVEFTPDRDRTGKYAHAVISPRSPLRPVYEQIYNHYVRRRGMSAPYVQRASEKLLPEGAFKGADHTGFGTLLYSRAYGPISASEQTIPGALHAAGSTTQIQLDWLPSTTPTTYTVARADTAHSRYRILASHAAGPVFTDPSVAAGQSYLYRVAPERKDSASLRIPMTAGLPASWRESSYGESFPGGSSSVAGDTVMLTAYGARPFGSSDELHLVGRSIAGDGEVMARLSPLFASQSATMGLMLRFGPASGSPMAALAISAGDKSERPQWMVSLLVRDQAGEDARTVHTAQLDAPLVTWGRIVRPAWLMLRRTGGDVRAMWSQDGDRWIDAGESHVTREPALAGCYACSGLGSVSAQVTFEALTFNTGEIQSRMH
jgi:hypothetical protein